MNIEPQSKAEARVLKRISMSQHWMARWVAPIAMMVLPILCLSGGVYLWLIGRAEADTFVVCVDTGKDLIPCPEVPFSFLPSLFFFALGVLLLGEVWWVLFILRERRIVHGILERASKSS